MKILNQKKRKNCVKIDERKVLRKLKKKTKFFFSTVKFVRIDNYVSEEINNDDEIMKNVKIKSTNKFSLF